MAIPPNHQFYIPSMPQPDHTQEDFDRKFKKIAAQNPDIYNHPVQEGEMRPLHLTPEAAALAHVYETYKPVPETMAPKSPERINLYEEEAHTLLDAMRDEEQQIAARDAAYGSAVASYEVKNSMEHANTPLTLEQIAAYSNSVVAFRAHAARDSNPADVVAIRNQSEVGLAA